MTEERMLSSDAARVLGARRIGPDAAFHGCAIDSRTVRPGQLFAALAGEHSDGHDHVAAAVAAGAAVVLVSRQADYGVPTLVVDDVRNAMAALARHQRRSLSPRVVGITGSNGKTTVKELVGAIASGDAPALVTSGNLNNDLGLPMTLLALAPEHRYAVLEMGANHTGEIAALASIAAPHVGLITHCGPAHLEGFGSIEGVAHAKGEMISALPADGVAVLNADDQFFGLWRDLAGERKVLSFGLQNRADLSAQWSATTTGLELTVESPAGVLRIRSALLGRHNVLNLLAATAAGIALGIEPDIIVRGISTVQPVPGRMQPLMAASGGLVINDSYNANPASLRAAVDVLQDQPGEHVVVLGDMAELGCDARELHREAGEYIRRAGVQRLLTIGSLSSAAAEAFGEGGRHFNELQDLTGFLSTGLNARQTVLVKGSRSMGMERVVQALTSAGN
ncbi:MAG: UDP-N-acetylmuramoyl-tripeptide--D-alanyl-D-alanine ligase [Pseudomonadota bacterium]